MQTKGDFMQPDIAVPKPTKEFHEAYEAVFGKKTEEKKELSLDAMDLPPPKQVPSEPKKGFLSRFFSKKQSKQEETLPPLDVPPAKIQDDFGVIQEEPSLDLLDMPPKKPEPLPPLEDWSLAEAEKELEEIAPSPKKEIKTEKNIFPKQGKQKSGKKKEQKAMLHDFLSEIKYGNGNEASLSDSSFEEKELAFEKETIKEGAKDLAQAFERKSGAPSSFSAPKEIKEIQKQNAWSSSAEARKYKKEIASQETKLKKQRMVLTKQETGITALLKKQQEQEKRLGEKRALVGTYDSKIEELRQREEAVVQKEKTAQQKLAEAKAIEKRLEMEENSIVKKIKQLQADEKLLEKEQDALLASVQRFEKEKQEVEQKRRAFQSILKDISDAESLLKGKSKLLDKREEQVRKREKMVQEEIAKLQKLKRTAEKLKDVEETYKNVRERLRKAYQEYEEKFTPSVQMPVQSVVSFHSAPVSPTSSEETGDITNLMIATKQMILSKQYDAANKNITRLMNKYMQISEGHPRKKEIYYEILSLKNMLKLDLLE